MDKLPKGPGYYVYLLRCEDDSLYCGWTTHVQKRFYTHVMGKGARYTKAHRPLELYYVEECDTAQTARQREYAIKQMSRKEKLALRLQANQEKQAM